ncbi:MAG: bifunctional SulP family inorganic anion transporter/carbonic anhydrase [Pirellula sp.]|jgi:MFS superfamily sulfate permease-like transporter/carbonic anhydrase
MGYSDGSHSNLVRFTKDLTAGVVVFLVALPLCLGIAVASNADPFSGIVSGVLGGLVVGLLSGSHTSVSGPAAGLTAIVAAQISTLGSFETFLAAVVVAGVIQIGFGFSKAGFLSAFVPSSVIKGLLSAIGLILIINQLPKLLGHQNEVVVLDEIVSGQALHVAEHGNVLLKLFDLLEGEFVIGPAIIGISSMTFLLAWERVTFLKKSVIPAPLLVVIAGITTNGLLDHYKSNWSIPADMLVSVPVLKSWFDTASLVRLPDFSAFITPAVYVAGFTIAIVASLETLLNLEAVDKIDPKQRFSPPNKELFAQGVGNVLAGLIGGLPMTSVIVRSSVNINAGGQSRLSTIVHGILLLVFVLCLPQLLNMIPYASLAAILVVTGFKLMSWRMIRELWEAGRYQFAPFLITVCAIVMTDLLIGILVGLGCSLAFVLYSNYRRPVRRILEKHTSGDVLRIQLANQVSFLNRAALDSVLRKVPRGGRVLIDASDSDYIDPDILALIRDFRNKVAPAHGVNLNVIGFESRYEMRDNYRTIDYTIKRTNPDLTPVNALRQLLEGNARFRSGVSLRTGLNESQCSNTKTNAITAIVLSSLDIFDPMDRIFDTIDGGVVDIRLPGNIGITSSVIASVEYLCVRKQPKLIIIVGCIQSEMIQDSIDFLYASEEVRTTKYGEHFRVVAQDMVPAIERVRSLYGESNNLNAPDWIDEVAKAHVVLSVEGFQQSSSTIRQLIQDGKLALIGLIFNPRSGGMDVIESTIPDWEASQ